MERSAEVRVPATGAGAGVAAEAAGGGAGAGALAAGPARRAAWWRSVVMQAMVSRVFCIDRTSFVMAFESLGYRLRRRLKVRGSASRTAVEGSSRLAEAPGSSKRLVKLWIKSRFHKDVD